MILIALGSNLGNRAEYLAQARAALGLHDIEIRRASSIVETPALMPEGAPADWDIPFLNQVVAVETSHAPHALLACLKLIEADLGREKKAHWAPREIDLDLLAYHDAIILTDTLTLPHPQMDARAFVLRPLAEIAPDWRHPVLEKTALEMLGELPQ